MSGPQIEETGFAGLKLLRPPTHADTRGLFFKPFNPAYFDRSLELAEVYYSESHANVIRGMHFQIPPAAHTKIVSVVKGAVLDVVVDLRRDQATFGKHYQTRLDTSSRAALLIPEGFAHGFAALSDETVVLYLQTSAHAPECDRGIRFDSFGFDWGLSQPILSDRDRSFPALAEFDSPF